MQTNGLEHLEISFVFKIIAAKRGRNASYVEFRLVCDRGDQTANYISEMYGLNEDNKNSISALASLLDDPQGVFPGGGEQRLFKTSTCSVQSKDFTSCEQR